MFVHPVLLASCFFAAAAVFLTVFLRLVAGSSASSHSTPKVSFVPRKEPQANSFPCSAGYVESTRTALDRRGEGMIIPHDLLIDRGL